MERRTVLSRAVNGRIALPAFVPTPKCVISKDTHTFLGYQNEELETYSIVATEITTAYEVEQVIKQLQSLIVQMRGNFVHSKGEVITDLHRIDPEESSTQKE